MSLYEEFLRTLKEAELVYDEVNVENNTNKFVSLSFALDENEKKGVTIVVSRETDDDAPTWSLFVSDMTCGLALPAEKAFDIANSLNLEYKYVRFYVTPDNNLMIDHDFLASKAEDAFSALVMFYNILVDVAPKLEALATTEHVN